MADDSVTYTNLPAPSTPVLLSDGTLQPVFWRLLNTLWQRTGGNAGSSSQNWIFPADMGTSGQFLESQGTGNKPIWYLLNKVSQLQNDSKYITLADLPTASTETKGIVKIDGTTITIDDGVISANTSASSTVPSYATIAAFRAVSSAVSSNIAYLQGFSSAGDGGEGTFYLKANDSSSDNTGLIVVNAAGQRWFRSVESNDYSVKWFGATGNGSTDDRSAIIATLSAAGSTHDVYFPAGHYLASNITSSNSNIKIHGAGRTASIIRCNSATLTTIGFAGASVTIEDLGFDSSATRTAGYFVGLGSGGNHILRNFYMASFYGGLSIDGAGCTIENGLFTTPVAGTVDAQTTGAIRIGSSGTISNLSLSNLKIVGASGSQPAFGILLLSGASIEMSNVNISACGNNVYIQPGGSAAVAQLSVNNCHFDNGKVGIRCDPDGAVARCRFVNCSTSGNSDSGVIIDSASSGLHFVNHEASANSGSGFAVISSSTTDITINGGLFAGNTNGIVFAANTTDFTIANASCGAYGTLSGNSAVGIGIVSGASDRYVIVNNRLHGNGAGLDDSGSGSTKTVSGNIT